MASSLSASCTMRPSRESGTSVSAPLKEIFDTIPWTLDLTSSGIPSDTMKRSALRLSGPKSLRSSASCISAARRTTSMSPPSASQILRARSCTRMECQ